MKEKRKALVVITWKKEPLSLEKLVLMLRVNPDRGAFWQPVTGSMDEGETFAETALREAEEETGFHFERSPQYLGLDYRFEGKWGPAHEQAFMLSLIGGNQPPIPHLDPKEHDSYQWVTPEEAIQLSKFPSNQEAIRRAASATPPLFLSRSGHFFQEGEEITHTRTVELLHRSLVKEGQIFKVKIGNDELEVIVDVAPRFVKSFDRETGAMKISDGSSEILRPDTLEIRPDHSLLCELQSGMDALFLSPAYYELMKDVRQESLQGDYVLHFLGRDYSLPVANQGEGIDR